LIQGTSRQATQASTGVGAPEDESVALAGREAGPLTPGKDPGRRRAPQGRR
jgi:hypothetical protein